MADLVVAPVSPAAATYAVEHWHYSHARPAGKAVTFGAWEDGEYIGAVFFGRGASPHLGKAYNLTQMQLCELTRVALRTHQAPVSQIVARSIALLRQTSPGLRLVVSFADPAQQHHGGIYQAGNWLYLGRSAETKLHLVDGRAVHRRTYMDAAAQRLRQNNDAPTITVPGKHRYVMPLDRAMRRRLTPHALPYPPRHTGGPSLEGETPSTPAG